MQKTINQKGRGVGIIFQFTQLKLRNIEKFKILVSINSNLCP